MGKGPDLGRPNEIREPVWGPAATPPLYEDPEAYTP